MNPIKAHAPQFVLSEGEHAGFAWLTAANRIGYRCGYVRVPAGHPWFNKIYEGIEADVHGGLTFAEPDTDPNFYWVGFDCGHSGDAQDPTLKAEHYWPSIHPGDVVRSQEYVEAECRKLCEQAKEAK